MKILEHAKQSLFRYLYINLDIDHEPKVIQSVGGCLTKDCQVAEYT